MRITLLKIALQRSGTNFDFPKGTNRAHVIVRA